MPRGLGHLLSFLLLSSLAGCFGATGRLQLAVAFPAFRAQTLPEATAVIRLVVTGQNQFVVRTTVTRDNPRVLLNSVPIGDTKIGAVAFDASGAPLAGGQSVALVKVGERTTATLDLQPGAVDPTLLAEMSSPFPSPSPSGSPSSSATPSPVAGPTPSTSASPTPVPTATTTALPTPNASASATQDVGSGVLATPTPGGVVTVLPGSPYSGPLTVVP